MTVTPRATPVIQPPSQTTSIQEPIGPKQLKAPIVVVSAGSEWEHEAGDLVIGRDTDANIVLEDPLVSRFHARLTVAADGRVTLEDLHSANGVFVNGNKLSRPSVFLGEGDRLLIGTTEISVFGLRTSAMVRLGNQIARMQPPKAPTPEAAPGSKATQDGATPHSDYRPPQRRSKVTETRLPAYVDVREAAPPPGDRRATVPSFPRPKPLAAAPAGAAAPAAPAGAAAPAAPAGAAAPAALRRGTAKRTVATTGKSDAVNLVGQFAEQLMESGHDLEAVRTLSEHLQNLLKGASAGLTVPPRILESATHYALRLHHWTGRNSWLEYVLELHLSSHQLPNDVSSKELVEALGSVARLDADLIAYFLRTFTEQPEALTAEQQRLADLLACFASQPPPLRE